jgi:hypothetical protein
LYTRFWSQLTCFYAGINAMKSGTENGCLGFRHVAVIPTRIVLSHVCSVPIGALVPVWSNDVSILRHSHLSITRYPHLFGSWLILMLQWMLVTTNKCLQQVPRCWMFPAGEGLVGPRYDTARWGRSSLGMWKESCGKIWPTTSSIHQLVQMSGWGMILDVMTEANHVSPV